MKEGFVARRSGHSKQFRPFRANQDTTIANECGVGLLLQNTGNNTIMFIPVKPVWQFVRGGPSSTGNYFFIRLSKNEVHMPVNRSTECMLCQFPFCCMMGRTERCAQFLPSNFCRVWIAVLDARLESTKHEFAAPVAADRQLCAEREAARSKEFLAEINIFSVTIMITIAARGSNQPGHRELAHAGKPINELLFLPVQPAGLQQVMQRKRSQSWRQQTLVAGQPQRCAEEL